MNWFVGSAWAPWYLVSTIPGLCALASLLKNRARQAFIVLGLAGFLISAPTLCGVYERYPSELYGQGMPINASLAWSVADAPLLHAWPAAIRQVKDASHLDVRELARPRAEDSTQLPIVAVWCWLLRQVKLPQWLGLLVAAALALSGLVILIKVGPLAASEPLATSSKVGSW